MTETEISFVCASLGSTSAARCINLCDLFQIVKSDMLVQRKIKLLRKIPPETLLMLGQAAKDFLALPVLTTLFAMYAILMQGIHGKRSARAYHNNFRRTLYKCDILWISRSPLHQFSIQALHLDFIIPEQVQASPFKGCLMETPCKDLLTIFKNQ